ncbi:hypothetical protein D3C72_1331330 [compost metagenome]
MHVQGIDIVVAAVDRRPLEQFRAHAHAAHGFRYGHAKLGHLLLVRHDAFRRRRVLRRERQMPHAHQLEQAVVDAINHVTREIHLLHVLGDEFIGQGAAKAQQAVAFLQRKKMLHHAAPVALMQLLDEHARTPAAATAEPAAKRVLEQFGQGHGSSVPLIAFVTASTRAAWMTSGMRFGSCAQACASAPASTPRTAASMACSQADCGNA